MSTILNPYEITKLAVIGEAYFEDIVFEKLPNELEDEINFGDCVIN
jgi:hydrocephalus-inducing protein